MEICISLWKNACSNPLLILKSDCFCCYWVVWVLYIVLYIYIYTYMSFIYGTVVKIPPASAGDMGSIPELRRFPWRRKWQPASAFLIPWTEEPGRLLVDYIHSVANNLTCQNQSMHLYNCNYTCSWFPMKGIWKLDEQILHNKEEDIKMGRRNKDTTLPIKSHIPHP